MTPTPAPPTCSASRSRAPSPTRTPTTSPTRSRTPSNSPTRTTTGSNTLTPSGTASPTGTGTATHSVGASASTTATATWTATRTPTASPSCYYTPTPWPKYFDRIAPIDPRSWLLLGWPRPTSNDAPLPPFDFRSVLPQGLPEFGGAQAGATGGGGFFAPLAQGPLRSAAEDAVNQLAGVAPPQGVPLFGGSLAQASPDGDDVTLIASRDVGGGVLFHSFVTLSYDGSVDVQTPGVANTRTLNAGVGWAMGAPGGASRRLRQGGEGAHDDGGAGGGDAAADAPPPPPPAPARRRAQSLFRPHQTWGKGDADVPPAAAAHLGDGRSFVVTGVDGSLSLVQRAGKYWSSYNTQPLMPPAPGGLGGLSTTQVGFAALLPCAPASGLADTPACVNGPTAIVLARGTRLLALEGVVESAQACGRLGLCSWPAHLKAQAPPAPRPLLAAGGNITAFTLVPSDDPAAPPGAVDIVVTTTQPIQGLGVPVVEVFRADKSGAFVRHPAPPLLAGAQGGRVVLAALAAAAAAGSNGQVGATHVGSLLVAAGLGPCYLRRIAMLLVDVGAPPAGGARRLQQQPGAPPPAYAPGGGNVVGTRLALFDPNFPEGSPQRLRVLGDPSAAMGVDPTTNRLRPPAALLQWPRPPAALMSPSASATPRLGDGSAPPSASPSRAPPTPPSTRSATPVLTREPTPSSSPRVAWAARGDEVVVLRAFAPAGGAVGASDATAALALDVLVADASAGRAPGTPLATTVLPWMTSDAPDESDEQRCTLPGNAPAGGLGAVWGPRSNDLAVACLGAMPALSPHAAPRHTFLAVRGLGDLAGDAWLRRAASPPSALARPPPHFTSIATAPGGAGGWVSNASGVYALTDYAGDGAWAGGPPRLCGICGVGGRACAGGVAQVLPRFLGAAPPAAPGTLVLFATTPTAVLYAPVRDAAGLGCSEAGGALAGVAGTALRGLTFATDNALFVADAARGLLRFTAVGAPATSAGVVGATWAAAPATAPAAGVGLLGVLYRNTPAGGGAVFATTASPAGAASVLYRFSLRTSTWSVVAAAPKGARYLGVFDPPVGPAANAASQTPAPTVSRSPSRSPSGTKSRKPK